MTQTESGECPICKLKDLETSLHDAGEEISIDCPRCGKFTITKTAVATVGRKNLGPNFSAWIRDHTESKREPPKIHSRNIETIESTLPDYTVPQKQLLLLRAIARRSDFPGKTVGLIPDHDFPLAWAANDDELQFYIRSLEDRGFVRDPEPDARSIGDIDIPVQITSKGWEFLDEQSRSTPFSDRRSLPCRFPKP